MMMARYIDANALMEQMKNACMGVMSGCDSFNEPLKVLESAPTVDVVEIITNELTNKISERIIQFLEENYDIIPKKPAVRCKDCVHLELLNSEQYYARCSWHGRLFPSFGKPDTRQWFCADGERKEDD